MSASRRLIPIYTTQGDLGAFLVYPYLFNPQGEWVGFITRKKKIYSVLGNYVGRLVAGPRIVRKRSYNFDNPTVTPPPDPGRIRVPVSVPLAPLMPDLAFSEIDVLQDEPDRLATVDADEFREDMD
jgi:hypothetical protein